MTGRSIAPVVVVVLVLAGSPGESARAGASLSCDCRVASSSAEKLVCDDPALAELDQRLARRYAAAVDSLEGLDAGGEEALAKLRAIQRGWIKGRNDCWKADDLRSCVEASYLQREGELVARYMLEAPLAVTSWTCDGNPANEVVAWFYATALPSVRLERGDAVDTGHLVRTASGSRYDAGFGRSFWIKGDQALLVWPQGEQHECVLRPES